MQRRVQAGARRQNFGQHVRTSGPAFLDGVVKRETGVCRYFIARFSTATMSLDPPP